jgi:hypothetical protein
MLTYECGWKDGDRSAVGLRAKENMRKEPGRTPAISFIVDYMDHSHPSRLPYGSLRSAWTGPGRDPNGFFLIRGNGRLCHRRRWLRLPLIGTKHPAHHEQNEI